ncbi:MAG: hypothetical protein IPM79_27560 [Polyangiaceae bacterium]|jgi:hypothetical protein|nr:hypothetical protein [Polyangiaceae bacterium]
MTSRAAPLHEATFGPHPDDQTSFESTDGEDERPLDAAETEAFLRWLETGEGEPWPPARSF